MKTLIACMLFSSFAFAAGKTAVLPIRSINLSPGATDAIVAVFASQYATASGDEVVIGEKSSANEYIELSLIGLGADATGGRIIVEGTRRTHDGAAIHRADASATSMKDVEDVTARLAAALHQKKSVIETRTPQTVIGREAEAPKRVFSDTVWGIRTGLVASLAQGASTSSMGEFGLDWRHESERYFIEWGFGVLLPTSTTYSQDSYGGWYNELGASYFLSQGSIAPYVGAGVLPRFLSSAPLSFAPYGQFGVMFPRESASRFYAQARLAQNVVPLGMNRLYPTELGVQVGVGW